MYKLEIYKWLIDLLKKHPKGLTFKQIKERWDFSCPIEDPFLLQKRTFHRYKQEIYALFGVEIECEKVYDRYVYRIKGSEPPALYELMLNDCISDMQIDDEMVDVKILARDGAILWLECILADIDYDESDPIDGIVSFEFKSAIEEDLARCLIPYADCMIIKEPNLLVTKMRDLLNASVAQINKQL